MGYSKHLSFLLLFILATQTVDGQVKQQKSIIVDGVDFECIACEEKWRKGESISPFDVNFSSPPSLSIKAPSASANIKFGIRFKDIDEVRFIGATCGDINENEIGRWLERQCPNSEYTIRYTITSNEEFANFNNDEDEISVGNKIAVEPPGFTIWENESVSLTTTDDWENGTIKVKVSIMDESMLPDDDPPNHTVTGSCDDDDRVNFRTYTIRLDDNIPKKLKEHPDNVDNDTWDLMWDPNENGYLQAYKYIAFPIDCDDGNEDFEEHVVNEEHTAIAIAFDIGDIREDWMEDRGIVDGTDQEKFDRVLMELFPNGQTGSEASFVLDGDNEFEDVHGHLFSGQWNDPEEVKLVFVDEAIEDNKLSYSFTQEYENLKNEMLSTNTLTREYRDGVNGEDWYIKKNHVGTCE